MFLSLYTDKAKGVLTEQRFMEADGGAGTGAGSQPETTARSGGDAEPGGRTGKRSPNLYQEIRRYAAIEELDESVLNRLISKILIGEVKKADAPEGAGSQDRV